MEKDVFRWIPYRFFVNESEDDTCKLERLAALFPNMKQVIELGKMMKMNFKSSFRRFFVENFRIVQK